MKKQLHTLMAAGAVSVMFAISASAATGWVKDNGQWFYYREDGTRAQRGWWKVGEDWYYFDATGAMLSNLIIGVNGKNYYVDVNGVMARNTWVEKNGFYHYAGEDGAFLVNTRTPDGYYVDKDGLWDQKAQNFEAEPDTQKEEKFEYPDISIRMSDYAASDYSFAWIEFTNENDSDITIYAQGSFLKNDTKSIATGLYHKKNENDIPVVKTIIVSPNEKIDITLSTVDLTFWDYNNKSEAYFYIEYKGEGFLMVCNPVDGYRLIRLKAYENYVDDPITLEKIKALPYYDVEN